MKHESLLPEPSIARTENLAPSAAAQPRRWRLVLHPAGLAQAVVVQHEGPGRAQVALRLLLLVLRDHVGTTSASTCLRGDIVQAMTNKNHKTSSTALL